MSVIPIQPPELTGLNLIGLRRSGVSNQDIKTIQKAYEIIFNNYSFRKNIENLSQELKENKFVNNIVKFINSDKKRPISVPSNDKWSVYSSAIEIYQD